MEANFTPRFETTIPKASVFTPPTSPPKTGTGKPRSLGVVAILALTFLATVQLITSRQPAAPVTKAPVAPTAVLQTPPAPPVPEVRLPTPATTSGLVPRAKLIHIRPIGTFERDTMPDGRVIGTTYRGELPSAANSQPVVRSWAICGYRNDGTAGSATGYRWQPDNWRSEAEGNGDILILDSPPFNRA